jgi:Putative Flp pilus-assembly TadE/G-like
MTIDERARPPTRLASAFYCLRRDERGVTAVLLALTLAVLIGMVGLGVETGLWYTIKRANQSAADVAALSGAFEILAGQPYSDMCGFAERDAARNGFVFVSYTCPTSSPGCTSPSSGQMCANNPPALPVNGQSGTAKMVEVILAQQQSTLFASLFLPNVAIDTRAVAVVSPVDYACLLALDTISINASLYMPSCSLVADSSGPSAVQVGASVTADTIISHGGVTGAGTIALNLPAQSYAPAVADPYASTLTHSFLTTGMPATCATPTVSGGVTTYAANSQICSGLDVNQTINLSPGTYWITDGNLNLDTNGTLECTLCDPTTGAGVTIILTIKTGTTVGTVTGNSTLGNPNFNAPNSGAFEGLLIVQDSNGLPPGTTWNTSSILQGGPNAVLNGLVYMPKDAVTFNGNAAAGGTGCLILVVDTLTLSGDSQLNWTGCSSLGVTPPQPEQVALTE